MSKQVYNNFNTNEKYELVCDYNKNLLKDFELQLKSEGKSEKTIKVYRHNIKVLFIYILEELDNIPVSEMKRNNLEITYYG